MPPPQQATSLERSTDQERFPHCGCSRRVRRQDGRKDASAKMAALQIHRQRFGEIRKLPQDHAWIFRAGSRFAGEAARFHRSTHGELSLPQEPAESQGRAFAIQDRAGGYHSIQPTRHNNGPQPCASSVRASYASYISPSDYAINARKYASQLAASTSTLRISTKRSTAAAATTAVLPLWQSWVSSTGYAAFPKRSSTHAVWTTTYGLPNGWLRPGPVSPASCLWPASYA